ncbi:MAG: DNA-binding response regulator [Flavobacteriales bacterium]|nr:MAG: DNA-binding response regulator [Flavobacteriales bacterium]PIE49471.1 MAG: DNA-binding response regulator [Flavobacteriales bacterium]
MLKTVLVDDEINALEALEWKLNRYVKDFEITKCNTPSEAIKIIEKEKPNLVFLDIEMPEMDGFTLLQKLNYKDFDLIFTTAHDEFALKAIKVSAIDYLLKPVDKDELIAAVDKVKRSKKNYFLENKLDSLFSNINPSSEKISIASEGKIYLLNKDEIVMLKAEKNYTTVHLEDKRALLVSQNLKEVEKKFKFPEFYRVHNSYLINLNHVKEYSKNMGGELKLTNEMRAGISRNKKEELINKLFN